MGTDSVTKTMAVICDDEYTCCSSSSDVKWCKNFRRRLTAVSLFSGTRRNFCLVLARLVCVGMQITDFHGRATSLYARLAARHVIGHRSTNSFSATPFARQMHFNALLTYANEP